MLAPTKSEASELASWDGEDVVLSPDRIDSVRNISEIRNMGAVRFYRADPEFSQNPRKHSLYTPEWSAVLRKKFLRDERSSLHVAQR